MFEKIAKIGKKTIKNIRKTREKVKKREKNPKFFEITLENREKRALFQDYVHILMYEVVAEMNGG